MNNLPPGYIEDDVIHYTECEQQPDGFPCICDHLAEARMDEEINNRVDEALLNDEEEPSPLVNEADKDTADTDLL